MASEYRLNIKGRDGVLRDQIVNELDLAYTRGVNVPGLLTFTLAPEHRAIGHLELDGQIEVWRRDRAAGIPWYRDFATFFRTPGYSVDTNGDETFQATCVGQMHLLSRRVVAYKANKAQYSVMALLPAETIMRRIVAVNCTVHANVANGRLRDGNIPGLITETDQGRGTIISWSGPWKNVLSELQSLAQPDVGGGDFDLVKTGDAEWTFRFYPGQLGTDRSTGPGKVVFAREFDNMGGPSLVTDYVEEKTVAIVGGQGEEQARQVIIQTGLDYTADDDIETFVDARQASGTNDLTTAGDRALTLARARPELTFTPLQTPGTRYGQHYFLGDLVLARYRGQSVVQKVTGATITLTRDGDEQVKIAMTGVV